MEIDSRTAGHAEYTSGLLMVADELYPMPTLTAGFVIHHSARL
jgi:hypothetical protein